MVFIKKLVMNGFKSFAKKTEILFDKEVNVILGPNGSGKSNITDALCFVLGRLSIKSIRAAKARNLLFMGSKYIKPAHEAYVELTFDNADRSFGIDKDEIVIKRLVRHNGQSTYKINDEVKTRIEILEMLAQAGIDPYGFNLILQGQIHSIVKMHSEERRKIIEDVAGISIYEFRKEKSLHELEKTEEKLKEISTILRERSAYLRNLDKERSQALRFKELETIIKRLKFSILTKNIESKQAELDSIEKSIGSKTGQKGKIQKEIEEIQRAMDNLSERINQINRHIQEVAGVEQETLHNQVANLKVEIEGIKVRKENFENRAHEIERRIKEMSKSIPEIQLEINGLKEKSPGMAKKSLDLKKKKEELAEIEEERKKALTLKTELNSLNERIKDKERQLSRLNAESESLLKQIEEYSLNLDYSDKEQSAKAIQKLKELMHSKRKEVDELQKNELKNEKIASISDSEITRLEKIRSQVQKIDICPLCQSKITPEHVNHVSQEASEAIKKEKAKFGEAQRELEIINSSKEKIWKEIQAIGDKISLAETGLIKQRALEEKKEQLKKVLENEGIVKGEIRSLEGKIRGIEDKSLDFVKISENYDSKMLEIEEISSRTEEDIDTTLLYKERDLEQIKNIIERSKQDAGEINVRIEEFSESLKRKTFELVQKEEQERKLNEKFKKMFEERDSIQKSIQEKNIIILESQNNSRQIDDQINMLRIAKAKLDAEKESLEAETANCSGVEAINASFNALTERLAKSQEAIQQIGPINLRAVEVYESVKKEYDAVQEKVNVLEKEKQDILKIIEEIDTKKTRSFMKTFKAINTLFTRNFSQLSAKGIAFLEIENKEDIFSEGVNIVVKLAKGKFFDVTSLSGGEQTLVALSLLFAIQEFKPYHFYIFDEIDAALDKRNSERLANLLNQFMKSGQYIVITHNDAIIMNSNVLYGVSMHEGVSKILSIEIGEHLPSRMLDNEQQQQTSQNERVAQAP